MNEHADVELIAAFREGLLDQADRDRVGQHLSDCIVCAQRQAALDDVRARLAQAPPPALPPGLAQRLDAALAAEIAAAQQAASVTTPDTAATGEHAEGRARHGRSVARSRGRRRAGRVPAGHAHAAPGPGGRKRSDHRRPGRAVMARAVRPLAAVAAVVVLAGGGYLLANSLTQTPRSTSTAASGAQQSAKAGAAESSPTPRFAAPQAGAAAAEPFMVHSGTSYQPTRLREQAKAVARKYAGRNPSPGKAGYTTVEPLRLGTSLAGCLQRVTGRVLGLIVDNATYEGRQALVIIAPAIGSVGGQVWVVAPGCSAASHVIITSSGL